MRTYRVREDQSMWDIALQKFGSIANIVKVLDVISDPNAEVTPGSTLELEETTNSLASRFTVNRDIFSTYQELSAGTAFRIFDDTFDDTFE